MKTNKTLKTTEALVKQRTLIFNLHFDNLHINNDVNQYVNIR